MSTEAPAVSEFFDHDEFVGQLSTMVFEALGGVSVCWQYPEQSGEFNSTRAREIGEKLLDDLRAHFNQPQLGLATTGQILDEIRTRIEVYGPGLDYRTTK